MAAAAAGAAAEGIHNPIITDGARAMFDPQREYMDSDLLKALQSGDRRTVERFFPQEVSMAIDPSDADNIADNQARRRNCRGVTVGGNSALHIAADFGHLEFAELICNTDSSLLTVRNVAGETPLHCAARAGAGADEIVSLFISVAKRHEEVLRATDREGKTALYTAAQEGHATAARVLMCADHGLADIVDKEGISPLYVGVLSGSLEIVQILTGSRADGGETPAASFAGPNGQTALHAAAIIESPKNAEELLQWKSTLTKEVDSSGSTPLHYLATTSNYYMMRQLLKHDTSPAYLSDSKGLCSIHVASKMGRLRIIRELINCCPDMGELVDGTGRNFLHVAVEHNRENIVRFVYKHPFLMRMMNARDCEGNTPLHLAVKSKNQTIVRLLLKNISVRPNIVNKNGKTPLDLTITGFNSATVLAILVPLNPTRLIFGRLKGLGANYGPHRLDLLVDEMSAEQDQEKQQKKYETAIQSLAIVSVLIATVTFAAAFTMPGGYKADDHRNGGTPTLATKCAFRAFIFSDSLAFICSIIATILLMFAGSLSTDPSLRGKAIARSISFLSVAIYGMVIAFTTAVYVVLAPVNTGIAITICTFSFTSILLYFMLNKYYILGIVFW